VACGGSDSESFGDPGPETLDQDIGPFDEAQHGLDSGGVFEVDTDRATAPIEHPGRAIDAVIKPVDSYYVGSEIGQHHRRERRWAEPGQLNDPQSGQGSRTGGMMGIGCHGMPRQQKSLVAITY
jgi:hypothetical protein